MTDLIKLNIVSSLLRESPQEPELTLLNELILLNHSSISNGTKTLLALTESTSGASVEELFEYNNILLAEICNTIVLFSDRPFCVRVNLGEILENIYHYSFTSDNTFDIYVSNHNEEDIVLKYITAQSSVLDSSYVYG